LTFKQTVRETPVTVPRRLDSPYVFAKPNGNPPVDFRRAWAKALKKAELPHFRFHDLRHTFGSTLTMNGVDPFRIKGLMRHKTAGMVERYVLPIRPTPAPGGR